MQEGAEFSLVQAMRAHRGEVTCLDAVGAWLATGGADRTLRTWRWAEGAGWTERAEAAAAHRHGVTAIRWAPAGVLLASAGVDGAVRLWDRSLKPHRRLLAPGAAAARSLCWAGGCARLLVGHDDGALCAWCVSTRVLVRRMVAHEGSLRALAVPALGALLLTACTEGVLKAFDLTEVCTGGAEEPATLVRVEGAHDLGALCADASESGAAATGGQDGRIRRWVRGAAGSEPVLREWGAALVGHGGAVTAVRWARSALGEVFVSASLDRTARVWAATSPGGSCLCVLHAHARYITCVAAGPSLLYLLTGSNDSTVRTWTARELSLQASMEPPCEALAHFALGDLQGIGPPDETESEELESQPGVSSDALRLVWTAEGLHAGAINSVAAHGSLLATASSDGLVKILRWDEARCELVPEHELAAHGYPALAAHFGSGGRLLLTGGLDGRGMLWDTETGVQLRSLSVASGQARGGDAGGSGVRAARLSPHRPPLLLLATDDGLAPLWSIAESDPEPMHMYVGHADAVTCCAWAPDGSLLATGAASGELRLLTAPPEGRVLHHEPVAHDLGVQCCEFASGAAPDGHTLATGGADSLVKLWVAGVGGLRLVRQFSAHGGGVTSLSWAEAALATLVTAGSDGWARVWRVSGTLVNACGAAEAAGALSVALVSGAGAAPLLAVGTLGGGLTVWQLPTAMAEEGERVEAEEAADAARLWGPAGVARWLREYMTCGAALAERAVRLQVTGPQLLDEPVDRLLERLGCGDAGGGGAGRALGGKLREELQWLRQLSEPRSTQEHAQQEHALLCPLTHRVLREPAAAADGYTYERAAILEWLLAGGSCSPVSGRRLASRRVRPNLGARDLLRELGGGGGRAHCEPQLETGE